MTVHTGTTRPTVPDPREPSDRLLRDLRTGRDGLTAREAARRLQAYGPNTLVEEAGPSWVTLLVRQLVHPLALLLWLAAGLAAVSGSGVLAVAIVVVVALNAAFAFAQERHAEQAVAALKAYLPEEAVAVRDGRPVTVPAADLVPGDVLVVEEGDKICADARLLEGTLEVDLATLTGESQPVIRGAEYDDASGPLIEARELLFSGTTCLGGAGRAVVVATGMNTELGRIAALSQHAPDRSSPLEREVRRVAWLIAGVAVVSGLAFLPIGTLLAGLRLPDALSFAIGLIVANVPEGLLPTITLALAVGVGALARQGALVKRLSAVETLGSTSVICTDKTGTLTMNQMHPVCLWTPDGELDLDTPVDSPPPGVALLGRALAAASTAELAAGGKSRGEATEVGLLEAARALGTDVDVVRREHQRRVLNRFDPKLRLMSSVDERLDGGLTVHCKGAPEEVLARCTTLGPDGARPLTADDRSAALAVLARYAARGLRVLAVARRRLEPLGDQRLPDGDRETFERDLAFLGLVALFDPPRPEVAEAVAQCHTAGIRVIVVTGDYGPTAAEVARQVGIQPRGDVLTGADLARMTEDELDDLLGAGGELVFSRVAPEDKLRIADALRARGDVVAMTGDGVNDAPALRRADIGVAMGRSGTDVAREAATMVLTDDNFATIVKAVSAGRTVFADVRKFVLYIFAHATPEVVPFLVFALAGGRIPLPLTVLQILAIDLGTEILPALALGREPAEPGHMSRPPRPRSEGLIKGSLLVRAWAYLGLLEAALVLGGFFAVLLAAGWHPGASVAAGSVLHGAYERATTMTFAGIVACQIGTALAARTEYASLRSIGVLSNRLLLWGLVSEVVFVAVLVWTPIGRLFGTAPLGAWEVLALASFPAVVWGSDELRRWAVRRRRARPSVVVAAVEG